MANVNMPCDSDITLNAISRNINSLNGTDRTTKKLALEGIRKEVVLRKPALDSDSLREVFSQIRTPLLQVLQDPVEKCRLLSIGILSFCLKNTSKPEDSLPYVIPALFQRFNSDQVLEKCDEVRLELITLLKDIVQHVGKESAPYVEDICDILRKTIVDRYAEVVKQSCKCLSVYAATNSAQFYLTSDTMIEPLKASLTHNHSRVKVEVIQAIGNTIRYGNNKSVDAVLLKLTERLFDNAYTVRLSVTRVVGNWLLELMDRYSFFHKLIPLLLTSMEDEIPQVKEEAKALWHDVGLKYEKENVTDLKDKMDFMKPDPEHYPLGIERPNLGCRTLMYHHFSKMITGINNDISDWLVASRVKSAQLLYTLLLNMEENVTMHLEKVVHTMAKGSGDDEPKVVAYVEKCAKLIGYFVPPDIWVKMVLKQVKLSQTPGLVQILSSVISGSQQKPLKPYLPDICNVIGDSDICQVADTHLQTQLCSCLDSIIEVAGPTCDAVSLDLFAILIALRALGASEDLDQESASLLAKLAKAQGMESTRELFFRHSLEMVQCLEENSDCWTQMSTERLLFDTLLMESGPVVGEMLDSVMPIFKANLQVNKDVGVRLKFFTLLSQLLVNASTTINSQGAFNQDCIRFVIDDIILPNCVWSAGRTSAALRTVVLSCLWALLHGAGNADATEATLVEPETLVAHSAPLITRLKSTLDDDSDSTRLLSCRVLTKIFSRAGPKMDLDKLHQFYPDLLKRLDDRNNDICMAVCATFIAYIKSFSEDYQLSLWRAHYVDMYKGLLVHLDDPERSIQEEVLKVLKCAAVISPVLLLQEIESVKHKHRSTHYCDLLSNYIHSLPKPQAAGDS